MLKRCYTCKKDLPATKEFFPANRAMKDGIGGQCRKCRSADRRSRYKEDKGGFRTKKIRLERSRYARDPEKFREYSRERQRQERARDPEAWRAKKRAEMAKRSRERRRDDLRRWRAANPDAARAQSAKARAKNPLRYRISCLVRMHLVRFCVPRSRRGFENLFGYDVETLRRHLERQFTKKMSWENYGSYWELDHIVPMRLFPITSADSDAFRAAWALTNLRPLDVVQNRSKGGKRSLLL